MAADVAVEDTRHEIAIFAINGAGYAHGNVNLTENYAIPWLQDTTAVNASATWQVAYRDVVILRPDRRRIFIYNLGANDLNNGNMYVQLKRALLDLAVPN